jgi:Uri superfamily endonuclease
VARHLRAEKKLRWHIDYATILAASVEAFLRPGCYDECALAQRLAQLPGATPVVGFGNSDCRAGCAGHLVNLPRTAAEGAKAIAEAFCR